MPSSEMKSMKLGLEAIADVDSALGSPSKAFKSIHIAGTNGKGSVSWKIAAGLQQAGYKVGLFTSPHIHTPNERIRINLEPIADLGDPLPFELSYFEEMTMKAFCHFAQQCVDYAVIEVGLGGRLDATNIITPELAIITSIGFDHMDYLGETLEEITREKAGIMKAGVPTIIGSTVQIPTVQGVEQVEGPFAHYEEENQAIAVRALARFGLFNTDLSIVPPGRFQMRENVIFDVAHNLPAMEALFDRLKKTFPDTPLRVLVAFSEGKAHAKMLTFLQQAAIEVEVVCMPHERILQIGNPHFQEVFQRLKGKEGLLIVCGSHFMMEHLSFFQ